jgi:hypothetical protein
MSYDPRNLGFGVLEPETPVVHFSRVRPGQTIVWPDLLSPATVVSVDPVKQRAVLRLDDASHDVDLKQHHWLEVAEDVQFAPSEDCIARRFMSLEESQMTSLVIRLIAEEHTRTGSAIETVDPDDVCDEDELLDMLFTSPAEALSERLVFWSDVLVGISAIVHGRAPRAQYYSPARAKAWDVCCRMFRANSESKEGLPLDVSMIE